MAQSETQHRTAGGVEYELTRKRVRNINLRVRADGTVAVSAPARTPLGRVDEFVAGRAGWIADARQRQAQRAAAEAARPVPDKAAALALFEASSARIWPLFAGIRPVPPEIRVRDMRSRWGVCCPAKNRITLALRLASREPDLIDYVMLHEYCHFVWPDHQPHFWALVARYMPDWKERRARLRG